MEWEISVMTNNFVAVIFILLLLINCNKLLQFTYHHHATIYILFSYYKLYFITGKNRELQKLDK